MKLFARALAHADGEEQAEFLNDFFRELVYACRVGHRDSEEQLVHIAPHLELQARAGVEDLHRFCQLAIEDEERARAEIPRHRAEVKRLEAAIRDLRAEKEKLDPPF